MSANTKTTTAPKPKKKFKFDAKMGTRILCGMLAGILLLSLVIGVLV